MASERGGRAAPRVIVFAGPNGAGKTTHAEPILRALGIDTFVNADYIARGLTGRDTETVAFEAGRIMLRRLRHLASSREDFAFESTLASRGFAPFLRQLKHDGYRVSIFYFSLRSAALAVRRVAMRAQLGGHTLPSDIVKRRFGRSLVNFFALYAPLANEWTVFDNSTDGQSRVVASSIRDRTDVKDERSWQSLRRRAVEPVSRR